MSFSFDTWKITYGIKVKRSYFLNKFVEDLEMVLKI